MIGKDSERKFWWAYHLICLHTITWAQKTVCFTLVHDHPWAVYPWNYLRHNNKMVSFSQLRVSVHDTGNPDKTAVTTVRIPVIKNVNAPRFNNQNYEKTINENAEVGTSIVGTTASDQDKVGSSWSLVYTVARWYIGVGNLNLLPRLAESVQMISC